MTLRQFLLLLFISAIWGASFIFMVVLSPVFGPVITSSFRLLSASAFLFIIYRFQNYKINWKKNYKLFIILGIGNSAIPFTLYAYAALYLPASISVILNSTAPMFGAIFGYIIIKESLSYKKIIGLALGTLGVGVISSITFIDGTLESYISVIACILAASLYGISGVITKKYAFDIEAKELTFGSITIAGIVLLPFIIFSPISGTVTLSLIGVLIVFGVLCTAIAYLVYYLLIKELGAVKALTVTYLMPVFGIFWAYIYLDEEISVLVYVGLLIILLGIYLVSSRKNIVFIKRKT